MSRYSLAKMDNEYVLQADGQSILRLSSRRQAAKLVAALSEREQEVAGSAEPHQRCRHPQPPPQPKPQRGPQ